MFTDTHSHIHFRQHFPDVEQILERAKEAQVTRQIIVGCTPKDSVLALEFVKKYSNYHLWSTLGVHPHNADELNDEVFSQFSKLARAEKKIVALGEMGLDYFRNLRPREIQIPTFQRQLQLAKELDLPAIVHVRDAWEDALKILADVGNAKVVLHCFTGDMKVAEQCWKKAYHTSFSGVLTYPKNQYLREVAREAPVDKILIETDCPYLTPQSVRGKRNEPAFIVETAKELARACEISLEEIAQQTTQNAITLFGLH